MRKKMSFTLLVLILLLFVLSSCGNRTDNSVETTVVQTVAVNQPWLEETPEQVFVNNGILEIDLPSMNKKEDISKVLSFIKAIEYYEKTDKKFEGGYHTVVLVYPDYKISYGVIVPDGYMWLGINDEYTEYKISKDAATNLFSYLNQYVQDNPVNKTKP